MVGGIEWEKDIKEYSDIVLDVLGKDDSLVDYKESEAFTTKIKTVDFSNAIQDLNHNPKRIS
jgi:dTDP-glucose 4,6-dehydratase